LGPGYFFNLAAKPTYDFPIFFALGKRRTKLSNP